MLINILLTEVSLKVDVYSHQPALLEADEPPVPDDDVIQHVDPQHLPGCYQLFRHFQVFPAGGRIAGGMVVGEDDPGARFDEGGPHNESEHKPSLNSLTQDRMFV
jgi:hypothetical protein